MQLRLHGDSPQIQSCGVVLRRLDECALVVDACDRFQHLLCASSRRNGYSLLSRLLGNAMADLSHLCRSDNHLNGFDNVVLGAAPTRRDCLLLDDLRWIRRLYHHRPRKKRQETDCANCFRDVEQ